MTSLSDLRELFFFASGAAAALLGVWLGARLFARFVRGETNVLFDGKSPSIDQDETD
ncbi:MAG: hypothetical protein ACYS8X_13630 [Planctomycetota bacterium]